MPKLDIEDFTDKELSRIYIADRLAEAKSVESTLTKHEIDFAVEVEPFRKILLGIFPLEYPGAAFYVLSGQAPFARKALFAVGLRGGLQDDEAD
ncbi:MAG TPA: hypothetical protein VKV95_21330 [Terriglobia bacterium]|nr:hypothetical protein [Terriglobia bacterium]